MKVPVCRIFVVCLLLVVFLAWPVLANPIEITLVNYSIYQNGQPINDSINLSVKCYGSYNEYRLKAMGLPKKWSTTANSELIYSYTLSCKPGNCYREDTYNPTWGMIISSCDLEGIFKGEPFLAKNFTIMPEPTCYTISRWNVSGVRRNYVLSFEDLKNCSERYPSESPESARPSCYEKYSRQINISVFSIDHLSLYCEKRFDIPSESQTFRESSIDITRNTYTPRSPVESLYCTLQQLFGGRCE